MYGATGPDKLYGNDGDDLLEIYGGPGYDHLQGGAFRNTVFTGHKRPKMRGCENVVNRYKAKRRGTLG